MTYAVVPWSVWMWPMWGTLSEFKYEWHWALHFRRTVTYSHWFHRCTDLYNPLQHNVTLAKHRADDSCDNQYWWWEAGARCSPPDRWRGSLMCLQPATSILTYFQLFLLSSELWPFMNAALFLNAQAALAAKLLRHITVTILIDQNS